ncbi:MAG: trypsin-like serine protease [Pirellulaceae bacterium]|nr:trypsin-like serine protease [Pirellulaceae bacterium]
MDFEKCEERNLLSASTQIDLGGFLEQTQEQYLLGHLNKAGETAYLQQGASDLKLVQIENGDALTTSVFQQTMDGLPVHGSFVSVSHNTNGNVVNVNNGGTRYLATEDSLKPQLTSSEAQGLVNQAFDRASISESAALVWFQKGDRAELAWRVDMVVSQANTLGQDLEFMTVVDANSGEILSQVQSPSLVNDLLYQGQNGIYPRITINDAIGAQGSKDYAAPFDSVVAISVGCTGTLIAENVVISARHCGIGAGDQILFGDNSNSPDAVFTVQSSLLPDGNGSLLDGGDVVILTLTGNVPSSVADPMRFIDATNELEGMTTALLGYGYNGLGSTGHGFSSDGIRWGGENVIDVYGSPASSSGSNIISTDFDDGSNGNNTIGSSSSTALEFEATTAPGDSGGPVLVQQGGQWLIAGVLSGGTTSTSVYGDISWWTGTAIYRAEIEAAGGVFGVSGLGQVGFDKSSYLLGDTAVITVTDTNGVDPVEVTIISDSGDSETLVLSDAGGGTYTNSIATDGGPVNVGDGILQTASLDQITVSYVDPDDGNGGSETVQDSALVIEPSEGVLIGVDFAEAGNPAPTNWTSIAGGTNSTVNDLSDEDGNATVVDLAIAELTDGTWDDYAVTPGASTIPQNANDLANVDGQIYTGADALRLTLQDLSPNAQYEVFVMAAEGFYTSIQQVVTITGTGTPTVFNQNFATDTLFINGEVGDSTRTLDEYAAVIESSGSGEIIIDIAPDGATSDVVVAGLAIREIPVVDVIDPLGKKFLDGVAIGGLITDAQVSDDIYYNLGTSPTSNPLKQKIDLILVSEYSGPLSSFEFVVEANMTGGAEGDVMQTVRLWNHEIKNWEIFDTRDATNADSVVTVAGTGDLSRFVKSGTGEIISKISWLSPEFSGTPYFWNVNVDQFGWVIS